MKKALLILMAALALLLAAACSGDSEDVGSGIYGDEPIVSDMSDDDITLEDLDGWWYLADGYPSDGVVMVQMFRLDAEAGTWTTYDEWGEEYYVDDAYLEVDGRLCLVFELGDAYFIPEGNKVLLDEETGEVTYVMGEPPEESGSGGLDGKWYKNGDPTAAYYLFEGNACKKIPPFVEESSISSDPYLLKEQEYYQPDGSLATGTGIELDDPYAIDTFILSDGGTFFFIPNQNTFYMREDVIGTAKGDEIAGKYRLMSIRWGCWSDEGYESLELCDNDIFVLNRQTNTGVELVDNGSWSLDKDILTLYFTDGSSQEIILSEDVSLTVERYGITFTEGGE